MHLRPPIPFLVAALLSTALTGAAGAATPDEAGRVEAAPKVLHRVVWTVDRIGLKGIHLRSARLDGTDVRRIYDTRGGFTLQLTLDPRGRRVAFATCCRREFGLMVVIPVLGGEAVRPLAPYPEFDFVGPIGWSPNGRRIAFEGARIDGDTRTHGIWTVRTDGSDLQHVLTLPSPSANTPSYTNAALAWTDDGILYSDGTDMRAARGGQSRLVKRNVTSLRIAGDQRHLVVTRIRNGRRHASIIEPDGSGERRLVALGLRPEGTSYLEVFPNYDGTHVMASLYVEAETSESERAVVTWNIADGPQSATVLEFLDATVTHTWN